MEKHKTAAYKVIEKDGGRCYRFFCEASGMAMVTTGVYRGVPAADEAETVWTREGREHFNLCHKCGKWVMDAMFNADALECVSCAPWENIPQFCKFCGTKVHTADNVCPKCGKQMIYGGSFDD